MTREPQPSDPATRVAANRDLWEDWTGRHLTSEFYDVEGFLADPAARPPLMFSITARKPG